MEHALAVGAVWICRELKHRAASGEASPTATALGRRAVETPCSVGEKAGEWGCTVAAAGEAVEHALAIRAVRIRREPEHCSTPKGVATAATAIQRRAK